MTITIYSLYDIGGKVYETLDEQEAREWVEGSGFFYGRRARYFRKKRKFLRGK